MRRGEGEKGECGLGRLDFFFFFLTSPFCIPVDPLINGLQFGLMETVCMVYGY